MLRSDRVRPADLQRGLSTRTRRRRHSESGTCSFVREDTNPLGTTLASLTTAIRGPLKRRYGRLSSCTSGGGRRSGSRARGTPGWPPRAAIATCATAPSWLPLATRKGQPRRSSGWSNSPTRESALLRTIRGIAGWARDEGRRVQRLAAENAVERQRKFVAHNRRLDELVAGLADQFPAPACWTANLGENVDKSDNPKERSGPCATGSHTPAPRS
jgi:hypothetical protein